MTNFSELGLPPDVLSAVEATGYGKPTPIQEQAIPRALEGRDIIGIAQTGTGKTASFTLPIISMLSQGRARARLPRSVVLAPTRELAAQVAESFKLHSSNTRLSLALLIGGVSFKEQLALIDTGVDVLVATPGRLLDHFGRGRLLLSGVQIMVVDEADRMLDMGFIPDIEKIFKLTPFTRQTLFFSATMAPEIEKITSEFLSNPVRVEVTPPATTVEKISHVVKRFAPTRKSSATKEKRAVLRAILAEVDNDVENAIIFCNRKNDVNILLNSMTKHGIDCGAIHGDLDQSVRTDTLGKFRKGLIRYLIASDVAARGLDIPRVSHVFNFDVPTRAEDYVHRTGRTGRAGRSGIAITIATRADSKPVGAIEGLVGFELPIENMENPVDQPAKSKSGGRSEIRRKSRTNASETKSPGDDAVVGRD
ncbi:MAG: DEAD/DEAH box helicase, partial [Albidovulum sp.]|nr:DEAD/DEAH box helicase [Albidovulum sp.]